MFQQMKYMDLWARKAYLAKIPLIHRIPPTQLARLRQITSLGHGMKRIIYQQL